MILVHFVKRNAKKGARIHWAREKEGDMGHFLKEGSPGLLTFTFRELLIILSVLYQEVTGQN